MEKIKSFKNNKAILYTLLVAFCFFYTGSAYMSQMYLLTDYYGDDVVDLITSGLNYLLQALGITIFIICIRKWPVAFRRKNTFIATLIAGIPLMAIMLLSESGPVIVIFGSLFNLLVGLYFGYYLTFLSAFVGVGDIGKSYGFSYAVASVGTYFLTVIDGSEFLVSDSVVYVYIIFAVTTIMIVYCGEDLPILPTDDILISTKKEQSIDSEGDSINIISENEHKTVSVNIMSDIDPEHASAIKKNFRWLVVFILIMSFVSSIGSGLYLSLPGTSNANFTLGRAFYAVGLISAGFIIDRSRQLGELITLASLTYPLIATSILYNSENGTVAVCLSYLFIGFIAVYRVVSFTDLKKDSSCLLPFAAFGLMLSRLIDVAVTVIFFYVQIPLIAQLLVSTAIYSILLVLFVYYMIGKTPKEQPLTEENLLADFSKKYNLTARESEILSCIRDGLSDSEIAEKYFISKSTVRFHISNLLKKTDSGNRVDAVRKLQMHR